MGKGSNEFKTKTRIQYIMKKILILLSLVLLSSCNWSHPVPIEKHKGMVVVNKDLWENILTLKSPDTIYSIIVLGFDFDSVKVGDTIR